MIAVEVAEALVPHAPPVALLLAGVLLLCGAGALVSAVLDLFRR